MRGFSPAFTAKSRGLRRLAGRGHGRSGPPRRGDPPLGPGAPTPARPIRARSTSRRCSSPPARPQGEPGRVAFRDVAMDVAISAATNSADRDPLGARAGGRSSWRCSTHPPSGGRPHLVRRRRVGLAVAGPRRARPGSPRRAGRPRSAWRRGRPCRRRGIPATWWAMALAVSAMIGVRGRPSARSRARIARVAVGPSITGICMSIRIRSQGSRAQASTASRPSPTITGSTPTWASRVLQHQLVHARCPRPPARAGAAARPARVGSAGAAPAGAGAAATRGSGRSTVKVEPSPGALSARDRAAHQLGQLAADRQAQARAAVAAGGRGVGLGELLEQAGRAARARCRCRCRRRVEQQLAASRLDRAP